MTDEIHDHSRVDAFMAARRRAMVLHSLWRPLLAGAVGAALVIAAVAIAQPRFTTREVIVDHVVQKDVRVDHLVPHDTIIEVPHIVPKDVEIPIPRVVEATPTPTTVAGRTRVRRLGSLARSCRAGPDPARRRNGFDLVGEDGSETFSPQPRSALAARSSQTRA